MPSAVSVGNVLVVNVRALTGAYPEGQTPPGGGGIQGDSGSLRQYLLSSDGQVLAQTTFVPQDANRPHTTLVGNRIISTWDGNGHAWLRVQEVSP